MNAWLWVSVVLVGCAQKPNESAPAPPASTERITLPMVAKCADAGGCTAECDAGNASQCRLLGNLYALSTGAEKDEARGLGLLEHACNLGDALGCVGAGRLYESGKGAAKDEKRAAQLYSAGCDLGDDTSCYNSAIMLESGRGVTKDDARAVLVYDKVCSHGAATACNAAARLRAQWLQDGGATVGSFGNR